MNIKRHRRLYPLLDNYFPKPLAQVPRHCQAIRSLVVGLLPVKAAASRYGFASDLLVVEVWCGVYTFDSVPNDDLLFDG
jgi:hypothetical protein